MTTHSNNNNWIRNWLYSYELTQYASLFEEDGCTKDDLIEMTDQDVSDLIKDLGIKKFAHKKRLRKAIKDLKLSNSNGVTKDNESENDDCKDDEIAIQPGSSTLNTNKNKEGKASSFFGSLYKSFQSKSSKNIYSVCGIKPNNKYDKLMVIEDALTGLTSHFHDIISLIGRPGQGKSTLASGIYNCMRSDTIEYFKISEAILSYTKGLWFLKEKIKVLNAKKDKIDILDLEGIEDEDGIYYLVVSAMVLSKAMLLCSKDRLPLPLFKIINTGTELFKKFNIHLPKPVIFMQIPYGQKLFDIDDKKYNKKQLIQYFKNIERYEYIKEYDIRLFELPKFRKHRFEDERYMKCIEKLVNEIKKIPEQIRTKQRVKYVKQVVNALNSNSPDMIIDLNFKFFKTELDLLIKKEISTAVVTVQERAKSIRLEKNISYVKYCNKIFDDGKYYFYRELIESATNLPYYDKNVAKFKTYLTNKVNKNTCFINVKDYCQSQFRNAKQLLKADLETKGNQLMKIHLDSYKSFVNLEITEAISKIAYKGSTYLPYNISHACNDKKRKLNTELLKETENQFRIPDDHLNLSINSLWETEINVLKSKWNKQRTTALTDRRYVQTSGNHKCMSCNADHKPGVCHKACQKSKDPLWIWVDGKTQYCICESCHEERIIKSVVCYSCSKPLGAHIIKIN